MASTAERMASLATNRVRCDVLVVALLAHAESMEEAGGRLGTAAQAFANLIRWLTLRTKRCGTWNRQRNAHKTRCLDVIRSQQVRKRFPTSPVKGTIDLWITDSLCCWFSRRRDERRGILQGTPYPVLGTRYSVLQWLFRLDLVRSASCMPHAAPCTYLPYWQVKVLPTQGREGARAGSAGRPGSTG